MWIINTTERFDGWFDGLDDVEQASVLALAIVLKDKGPALSRPYADTVNNSCHRNMKELRIQSKGEAIRAFLLLTLYAEVYCFALDTKPEMKNDFMMS